MSNRNYFYFYAFTILLFMCFSYHMLFTWYIPKELVIFLSVSVPLLYMGRIKCDTQFSNSLLCVLWGVFTLYIVLTQELYSFMALFRKLGEFLCVVSVILLPIKQKQKLLAFVTIGLSIIIAISLPPWILHLIGIPLPHTKPFLLENGFHWVTNYYFFLAGDEFNVLKFPRFRGMCVEGGHVAPICVFLYLANDGKLLKWQKITLLSAIILSFSLAAYCTFIICYLLKSVFYTHKYRLVKLSAIVVLLFGSVYYFNNPINQNNPFYNLIIQRLEYDDEKGIAGNNRTTDYLNQKYKELMKSDRKYVGLGKELRIDNWTNDSSGIIKFIVWNGLIGTSMFFLMMFILLLYRRSYMSFVLWFCAIMNFLARDLLTNQMWIIIVILGVFVLHRGVSKPQILS